MIRRLAMIALLGSLPMAGARAAASCSLAPVTFEFGTYVAGQMTSLDASAPLKFTCSSDSGAATLTFTVAISGSSKTFGAKYSPRQMLGVSTVDYNLFTDPNYSQVWGDGTNNTQTVTGTQNVPATGTSTATLTVYGRIPGGQLHPEPGEYNDMLTVQVTY